MIDQKLAVIQHITAYFSILKFDEHYHTFCVILHRSMHAMYMNIYTIKCDHYSFCQLLQNCMLCFDFCYLLE